MQKTIAIIKLQNQIDRQLDEALEIIEPIVVAGKKLTLRETKKMDALLAEQGLNVRTWLDNGDYFSILKIMTQDRYTDDPTREGIIYANDYIRSIYLDNDTRSITLSDYKSYHRETPELSETQIKKMVREYQDHSEQIKALERKRSDIKYCSYMR